MKRYVLAGASGRVLGTTRAIVGRYRDAATLLGVYDPNTVRACYVSQQCGGVPAYADFDEMLEETKPDQVIVLGKSLGGGVATQLVLDKQVLGLILESTFRSIPAVAKKLIPVLPSNALFKSERYESIARLKKIKVPVLVVHGDKDELIPYSEGEALFEAANVPKQMYRVEGAGHNDVALVAEREYGARLRAWLDEIS